MVFTIKTYGILRALWEGCDITAGFLTGNDVMGSVSWRLPVEGWKPYFLYTTTSTVLFNGLWSVLYDLSHRTGRNLGNHLVQLHAQWSNIQLQQPQQMAIQPLLENLQGRRVHMYATTAEHILFSSPFSNDYSPNLELVKKHQVLLLQKIV